MRWAGGFARLLMLALVIPACSADGGRPGGGGGRDAGSGPPPGPESSRDACSNGLDDDRDGLSDCDEPDCAWLTECGGAGDAGSPPAADGGFMGCAAAPFPAMNTIAPVDIIWVIDSSGSMDGEARIVQDNMNNFVTAISASGIDYHVVVITDPSFVSVPPPLGTDTMRYRFINHGVGSHEPLQALVSQYPMYMDFLRPTAVTHFVIVTDDESNLASGEFQTTMTGLLGHAFVAHAIASPDESHATCGFPFCPTEPGCTGPNGDAADIGREYMSVTAATGGRFFSICTLDWSALFTELSAAIAIGVAIPCTFEIPAPPVGMTFDRTRVNVVYTSGDPPTETVIGYVADYSACDAAGGWYYDDPAAPTTIVLCPASCDVIGVAMSGSVDIALGCETVIF